MQILARALEQLKVGPARTFGGLTLYPLLGPDAPAARAYRTLDEALGGNTARVVEVDASGRVPELHFVNDGDRPVLLLDGEELIGAKQNRVLNLTILAPAGKTIVIPVSCVEAGRWRTASTHFVSSENVMFSSGRSRKAAQVSGSLALDGTYFSDQAEVWRGVRLMDHIYDVGSPTASMRDVFQARRHQIDDYVNAFPAVAGQTGAAFALGGRVRGIECFDHPDTLKSLLPKLVRSWTLDAMALGDRPHEVPPVESIRGFLDEVAAGTVSSHEALGLGRDLRLSGKSLAGGALVHDDRVVHLCAFRLDHGEDQGDGGGGLGRVVARMSPASRRARGYESREEKKNDGAA